MTAEPDAPSLAPVHRKALLDLRAFLARPGSDGLLHDADFETMGQIGLNPGRLRPAVEWLVAQGWLKGRGLPTEGASFKAYEFTMRGAALTDQIIDADDDVPIAADDTTRAQAAEAAEGLVRAVVRNNQIAAAHPERLPMYRASIEAGAGLLRAHAPTRAILRATMLDPAHWMLQQAATAAVRDAAEHAIRLLTGLL